MSWLIGLLRNLISQTNLEFENSKSCGRRQSGSAQPHSFEHRLSSNAIASLELLKPTHPHLTDQPTPPHTGEGSGRQIENLFSAF